MNIGVFLSKKMMLDRENKSRNVLHVTFEMSDWILSRLSSWNFESTCAPSVLTPLLFLSTLGFACALFIIPGLSLSLPYKRSDVMVKRVPDWESKIPSKNEFFDLAITHQTSAEFVVNQKRSVTLRTRLVLKLFSLCWSSSLRLQNPFPEALPSPSILSWYFLFLYTLAYELEVSAK